MQRFDLYCPVLNLLAGCLEFGRPRYNKVVHNHKMTYYDIDQGPLNQILRSANEFVSS